MWFISGPHYSKIQLVDIEARWESRPNGVRSWRVTMSQEIPWQNLSEGSTAQEPEILGWHTVRIHSPRRRHGPGGDAIGLHASECIDAQIRHSSIENPWYVGCCCAKTDTVRLNPKSIKTPENNDRKYIVIKGKALGKNETASNESSKTREKEMNMEDQESLRERKRKRSVVLS